jgi:hypothetical protein
MRHAAGCGRCMLNARLGVKMPTVIPLISVHFDSKRSEHPRHVWYHCGVQSSPQTEDELARWLAYRIVELRLAGSPQYYERWRRKVELGTALEQTDAAALRAFLDSSFPDPLPPGRKDQLQGAIAEYLWYFLQLEGQHCDAAIHVEPPKGEVTDKGGDGISFHESPDGEVGYRLWELKKYAPDSGGWITSTATKACAQLDKHGARYVAQFTAIGQKAGLDSRVKSLCSELPHHWLNRTERANAGVAIGTSHSFVSKRPFRRLGTKHLVEFSHPNGRQGLVCSVSDFAGFSESVRQWIWKGL